LKTIGYDWASIEDSVGAFFSYDIIHQVETRKRRTAVTTKKTSLTGYLFRWFLVMTFVVMAVVAAVQFRHNVSEPANSKVPRERRRTITPAQLIANIDRRIELEQAHCTALEQSIAKARESFDRLGRPLSFTKAEVDERQKELVRYADLVNTNEGVMLQTGEYVSATELRRRAEQRREELAAMTKQIADADDFDSKASQTIRQLETMRAGRQRTVAELDLLRTNLVEQVNLLASMTAAGDNNPDQPSLSSLRAAVERMQDMIEVRLEMAEEDSPLTFASGARDASTATQTWAR